VRSNIAYTAEVIGHRNVDNRDVIYNFGDNGVIRTYY